MALSQGVVKKLLNIIERLARENDILKSSLQKLSDEINRLKGEQRQPEIDGNTSSEAERKEAETNTNKNNGKSDEQ